MAIFAIGDLHLSLGTAKPMDIFDGWHNYTERLESNWKAMITDEDTVVIAGDISWAMKLEECTADFAFINNLPGKKIILKGNHDYWWTTMSKMEAFAEQNGFYTIKFLFNNCFIVDNIAICGTRSWLFDIGQPQDEKVMNREVGRLKASLQAAGDMRKLVFLHYPPLYMGSRADSIIDTLNEFGVKQCFYGHLHSASVRNAIEGEQNGIVYKLISADALNFCPYKICF
ncbi:MAG: metallophosphoesterase [Oscillospiraceae bacterium]